MIPEFVRYLTLKHTERFNFLFSVVSLRGGLTEEYLFIQKEDVSKWQTFFV